MTTWAYHCGACDQVVEVDDLQAHLDEHRAKQDYEGGHIQLTRVDKESPNGEVVLAAEVDPKTLIPGNVVQSEQGWREIEHVVKLPHGTIRVDFTSGGGMFFGATDKATVRLTDDGF